MSTAIALGFSPYTLQVRLQAGAHYVAELISTVDWPAGAHVELELGGDRSTVLWPAVMVGRSARWLRPPSEVDAALAQGRLSARLLWRVEDTVLVWAAGSVVRG